VLSGHVQTSYGGHDRKRPMAIALARFVSAVGRVFRG
jgi:hypothetical protein